jgi:hypothetical protein
MRWFLYYECQIHHFCINYGTGFVYASETRQDRLKLAVVYNRYSGSQLVRDYLVIDTGPTSKTYLSTSVPA